MAPEAALEKTVAACAALLCMGAAPAPAPAPEPAEPSVVDMARVDLGGSYFRGAMLVGHGTRVPYQGTVGTLRLDVLRFPLGWLGFEIGMRLGPATASIDQRFDGGLDAAALVAPLRWSRPWAGSVILGAGAGFGSSRPVWLEPGVHVHPTLLARLRLFPRRDVGLLASWRFTPVTSDALWVMAHDIESAVSIDWVQVGARLRLDEVTGGDPRRTYRGYWIGPFIGFAFFG